MSDAGLISVIVPAYNAAPFIAETIRSVLAQSYVDVEVIVVDDGSIDETANIARSLSDERLQVVSQPNAGVAAARNKGLDLARGAYITFLDADDSMEPTNLEEKLGALLREHVDWVFGDLLVCDADLRSTGRVMKGTDNDLVTTVLLGLDTAVPGAMSNAMFKRSCFAGGYRLPTHLSNSADQHVVLAMAKAHTYHHLPRALNRYRVLQKSMSRNVALYEADLLRLHEEARAMGLFSDPAFARACKANAYWAIAGSWWINGSSPARALPNFLRAVCTDPLILLRRARRGRKRNIG